MKRLRHGAYVGGEESPEHYVWRGMIARCTRPKDKSYPRYGGIGISVCDRWRVFELFLADMGQRPTDGHQLDRVDNTQGYAPSNCRWTTRSVQQKNKSSTRRWEGDDGFVGTLSEWAAKLGISRSLALHRWKVWGTFERGRQWQLLQRGA